MRYLCLYLVGFLLLCSSCIRRDETDLPYYLYSITHKSDINYTKISQIDSLPVGRVKLKNEFYPIVGNYTVLRFLSFDYGDGLESRQEFNNVLVLKLDSNSLVVDGYLYPLHWAELPLNAALHRITNKKVKLKNRQSIKCFFKHSKKGLDGYKGFIVFPDWNGNILEKNFIDKKEDAVNSEGCEFKVNIPLSEPISSDGFLQELLK